MKSTCPIRTLPEMNRKWMLGILSRFLLGWPIFKCELLVSGSVYLLGRGDYVLFVDLLFSMESPPGLIMLVLVTSG